MRNKLIELLNALITGNQVQIKRLNEDKWMNFRMSEDGMRFEAFWPKIGWRATAIGGAGTLEWRYPPTEQDFIV